MTAFFGMLQGQTLELEEGLNILQAPNGSGKSTWCAFLLSMLYGINSRERDRAGFIADKNRYAPWAGTAMSGRLDCRSGGEELTLIRSTRRPTSPMGDLQAVYAGTGDAVPGLTGQLCGEALLGVSREVFERSAFIRQSGLAVTPDVGLERRIAALITSGQEDVSYTEAAELLKKQLNRRRHNRTGQIPALEDQLRETERQLLLLEEGESRLADARSQAELLEKERDALREELAACGRWEASQRRQALARAQAEAEQAAGRAAGLRQRIEQAHLPENDAIGRLRGAIVNLETVRRSLKKAQEEQEDAQTSLSRAEKAVDAGPFTGCTPEQASRLPLELEPKPRYPLWAAVLFPLLGALLGGGLLWRGAGLPLSVGCGCGLAGLGLLIAGLLTGKRQGRWEARAAELRQERQEALDRYSVLYRAAEEARSLLDAKTAVADNLCASLSSNEQTILSEIRRFAPNTSDISAADTALRSCAVLRRDLAEADSAAREARIRFETLAQQSPAGPEEDVPPPSRDRETIQARLDRVQSSLEEARSQAGRAAGQLRSAGDPVVLRSSAQYLREQIDLLEGEFRALQLASSSLESANASLQSRFSPALGRRAAEIFGELTGGRYSGVTLDRSFHLAVEPAGDAVYRDAALLSAGALDQLYLAVRLAICELVLPEEKGVPIILDDALANFDDRRCAAALDWLRTAARTRQILLFTCHDREAELLRNDPAVSIQLLTAPEARV